MIFCSKSYKFTDMDTATTRRTNLKRLVSNYETQQEFADAALMGPQYLSQLIHGHREIGEKTARKIEAALGLECGYLDREDVSMVREPSNVSYGPSIRGKVPLISWVQAGKWREAIDLYTPGDAEDWIETTVPIKENTFALRVDGDSMEPEFPAGVLIVVEPDLDPQPGDYVIAKNGDDATFKQLVKDGSDWLLKPLNDRYPIKPLESPCKIIGVVRSLERRFR